MTTTAATGMPAEDDPPDPANDDHHLYEDFTYNYNPEDYDENFTISVEELLSVLDDPQPNDGARSPSKPNDSTENSISLQDGKYEVSGPPKDPMDAHFFLSGEHGYLQNYLDISSYDEGTLGGYVDVSGTSRKFTNTCSPGNESDVINSHVGDQYHEIHDVSSVVLSTLDLGIRTEACAEDAHSKFTNLANYNVGNSEKEESVYTGDNLSKVEVEPTEEMMTSDTKKYGGSDPSMTSLDKLGYFSGEDDRFHRELVQDPPNLGGKFCMSPSLESNSNCIESCSTGDSSNNISTEAANAHYSMQYLQTPVLASSSFEDSFEASMFLDEKDGKPCPFGRLYMENQADLDTIACSFKEPAKNVNIKHNVNYYEDMNFKNPFVPESSSLLGVPSSSEFIGHGVDDTKYLGLGELIPRFWRKDQLENGLSSLQHDCSFDEAIPLDIRQNSAVNNDAAKHILNNENTLEDLTFPTIQERFHNIKPREYIGSSYPEVSTSWSKAHDERLTFRIALQDLSQPTSEANPPDGVLAVPLLRHQRIALSWMVQKETCSLNCFGGILADDQGLGKTVSTIALILAERPPLTKKCKDDAKAVKIETLSLDDDDDGSESVGINRSRSSDVLTVQKPKRDNIYTSLGRPAAGTLVVCPTSVLRQWAEELQTKVTSKGNLSFLLYHGSNRTKDPNELSKYDVVLTTYSIVSMEVPKQLYCKDDEDKGRSDIHLSVASSSRKRKHQSTNDSRISNGRTKTDVTLLEANARPLAKVAWFRVILDEAQTIKNHRTHVARACCGLRAKRRWCLSGTPIQNAVDDLYSYFRFLRYEPYAEYISFCSTIKTPISKNPTIGYKKLQAVLKTIMLRRTKGTYIDGEPIINLPPKSINLTKVDFSLEERSFYSRLEAESREQFKVYADAGTLKQNYVNILLMLLRLRQACDHPHLVQGCDSNSSWMASLENAKKLPNDKQLHLLNCLEACLAICTICNDPPENAVVTICGHVFCHQCIQGHLTGDDSKCPSRHCDCKLDALSIFSKDSLKIVVSAPRDGIPPDRSRYELPSGRDVGCTDSSKIRTVMEILQSLPKLDSNVKTSYMTHNLPNHCSENVYDCQITEKAIVFSQWTRMLDLLEIQLKSSSLKYRRLDGTMSVASRDKAIKDFNTHPEVTVMIMSLKAASLGLNMVSACHVILLDLWWNPTTEDQAIDRAHRIGQTRPVTVSRLTVRDTVEDRILALQEKKREMVSSVFGEDEAAGRQTRLTVEDLRYLFMA